jgi:cytochrome oxidase Cu insertion factor (SCO1/SenC/PrrC family)
MRRLPSFAVAALLLAAAPGAGADETKPDPKDPRGREGGLKAGDAAPAFTVKDLDGNKTVSLADLKGKPVVLFFGSCT